MLSIVSPIEFEAVVRACASPREVAVLSVAFYAGLRLGELRELRWGRRRPGQADALRAGKRIGRAALDDESRTRALGAAGR
jgi:integrase